MLLFSLSEVPASDSAPPPPHTLTALPRPRCFLSTLASLCLKQSIGLFAHRRHRRPWEASPWESSERNRQFVSRFGMQRSRRDENSKNAKKLFPSTGQEGGGGRWRKRDWLTVVPSWLFTIEEWICGHIVDECWIKCLDQWAEALKWNEEFCFQFGQLL